MDKQTFIALIDKYREGIARPSEISLLEAYYKELESSGNKTFFTEEEERMLKDISYQRIVARIAGTQRVPAAPPVWRPWLAAAVVAGLIFLSGAGYLLMKGTRKTTLQQVVALKQEKDVPPAVSGAILTLADGSTVLLDSITNGKIAEQGPSTVVKKNGRIVYDARLAPANGTVSYNTISTPYGRQCNLVLPDGTVVFLNAGSSLTFPTAFLEKKREVQVSGEAYFSVAKKEAQPFIVHAGGMTVEALGTEFNINSYADEALARTTLVQGSVRVSKGLQLAVLKPGQQSVVSSAGEMQIDLYPDMEKILAWKNNTFLFDRDELTTIMRQLARWYDVQVVYESDIPDYHYSGIISRQRKLSAVLNLLRAAENINFKIDGKKVIVYQDEPK